MPSWFSQHKLFRLNVFFSQWHIRVYPAILIIRSNQPQLMVVYPLRPALNEKIKMEIECVSVEEIKQINTKSRKG
jgi:hypothetical protein